MLINAIVVTLVVVVMMHTMFKPGYLLVNAVTAIGILACIAMLNSPLICIAIGVFTFEVSRITQSNLAAKLYLLQSLNIGENHDQNHRSNRLRSFP